MTLAAYTWLTRLAALVAGPPFLAYAGLSGRHRDGLRQRLGLGPPPLPTADPRPRLWLHAASVGEVQVVRSLIAALDGILGEVAVVVSTVTPHGQACARQQLPAEIPCFFAPLDLPAVVRRVVQQVRPALYVPVETELWPHMLAYAHAYGSRLVLLNGRLSERSFDRYRRIRGLIAPLLARFEALAVIDAVDRDRYLALGADPSRVRVLGNAKYDLAAGPDVAEAGRLRRRLGLAPGQPVLVAGSTHTGEDEVLLAAFASLRPRFPDLVLVLAPRHLARLPKVAESITRLGAEHRLLSAVQGDGRPAPVILVDTMGDLGRLYGLAFMTFCGGSLVPKGGHNLLEAAVWGRPILFGPHTADFQDARELLERRGAGFLVDDAGGITGTWLRLASDQAAYATCCRAARQAALEQQGAARRQARLLHEILTGPLRRDPARSHPTTPELP
ncbi:MAG: glycosyltransferase N-terminal domain-containing protein [Thermodesulfobacteriota bacterium]